MKIEFHTDQLSVADGRVLAAILDAVEQTRELRVQIDALQERTTLTAGIDIQDDRIEVLCGGLDAISEVDIASAVRIASIPSGFEVPWDDRIHSTPASKTATGGWRKKRGVSDELVALVTAELAARGSSSPAAMQPAPSPVSVAGPVAEIPAPPAPESVAEIPAPPAPEYTRDAPEYDISKQIAEIPAPPGNVEPADTVFEEGVATTAPEPPGAAPSTFMDLMQFIIKNKVEKKKLDEIIAALGLSKMSEVKENPELIETFASLIRQ